MREDKDFLAYNRALEDLNLALRVGMENIKHVVQANVAGPIFRHAQGISFYFPQKSIHSSYEKTLFAQESKWFDFIKSVVTEEKLDHV